MGDAFWDFSRTIYSAPGVEQECLALQDDHGIDVNVLLFCAYAAVIGRTNLTEDNLSDIENLVAGWRQAVVEPLRQARRTMKTRGANFNALLQGPAEELRQRVKALELDAERFEQERLMGWLASHGSAATAEDANAEANIRRLLRRFSKDGTAPPYPAKLVAAADSYR